jgi:cation:H+ antiporter
MLIFLAAFLFDTFRQAERAGGEVSEDDLEGGDASMEWWRVIAFLGAGIIGLPVGAHLLVEGATGIAQLFGVSEAVIGLTLVAIGTSLPELSTTVAATLRGHSEVALGNVIGSNIFNVLAIMGVASFFGPLPLPEGFLSFDLWIMLACSLILFPFVWYGKSMGRLVGIALVGAYVAYLGVVVI